MSQIFVILLRLSYKRSIYKGDEFLKRLILGGIPCAASSWTKLFPESQLVEQKIVPFFDILSSNYRKRNFSELVHAVQVIILDYEPDEIILHDISVTIGLLALLKIKKINSNYIAKLKVIIFNGAFSGFDVNKSPHPIRAEICYTAR